MSMPEARQFLRGFLLLVDHQNEEADDLRDTYTQLCVVDDQLKEIAAKAPWRRNW